MCSWCTFDIPHMTLKSGLTLYSLCPFKFHRIWKLICEKQQHFFGIRWNLQWWNLFSAPPLDTGAGNKCKSLLSWSNNYPAAASLPPNCLTCRSSLQQQRGMSPERAAAKLRNPSVEPACFRLCCSEVEQKWLCLHKPSGLHGFYIPKQLAATLMRTTEGLLWQLMLFGRMESGRRMWCSGVCRPDGTSVHGMFGLRYFPPPPIVYISFKISLSGVVSDGHESPRLFSKQYIISDAMMCSLYFHTSRVEQNI